ncbi:hypothetical protein TPB0596_04270 [Tsukamurella pulmonis]|uniref:hypothetical protein n=1 Tax=Tsukamurella pulmonis TaxID=47312 RepID=UPI001EE0B2B1|nr:hypothetical protein [Tsukamurella pulmonis]BDD80664.1 hypothetical protein TPB0596_04270 [Tsukamurella pulmonis]
MDDTDLESRAHRHLVMQHAAALHRALAAMPPDAARLTTGGDRDAVSQLASRMLWASTEDLNEQGRYAESKQVVARAAELAAEGVTELALVTNSLDISELFWRTVYPDAVVERLAGELRVTPPAGPALLLVEALAAHLITTVDMEIVVDAGAAERLSEAGFDVSRDGRHVVDVNATDSTVRMEVRL